jgi:hypothetical protein
LNQNHDLTQACFKTLTYLINIDKKLDDGDNGKLVPQGTKENNGENALAASVAMPLNSEQMKVLISLLQVSVAESDQHNPALGLIKAILSRRYTSPEFYDLMESMLKLVVRSQKASLRQVNIPCFFVSHVVAIVYSLPISPPSPYYSKVPLFSSGISLITLWGKIDLNSI